MFRQLGNSALLCSALFIAGNGVQLLPRYQPAQRHEKAAAIKASHDTEYRLGDRSIGFMKGAQINKQSFVERLNQHAQRRIECLDAGETRQAFDKPLPPGGWLYHPGATNWKQYFDTSRKELWVMPNVYCDKDRVLIAISWMRSGQGMHKPQQMAWRFREHRPPDYAHRIDTLTGREGVFCHGWQGWLFEKNKHHNEYLDTDGGNELFTAINVYCDNERVTYLQAGFAGEKDAGSQRENVLIYPFSAAPTPASDGVGIGCAWQGWLFKSGTEDTWMDNQNRKRWTYEKYFAIDHKETSDKDKEWMQGQVINPFCSEGKVTRLRTYCFYAQTRKGTIPCAQQ